jgi:hypothetical protein
MRTGKARKQREEQASLDAFVLFFVFVFSLSVRVCDGVCGLRRLNGSMPDLRWICPTRAVPGMS